MSGGRHLQRMPLFSLLLLPLSSPLLLSVQLRRYSSKQLPRVTLMLLLLVCAHIVILTKAGGFVALELRESLLCELFVWLLVNFNHYTLRQFNCCIWVIWYFSGYMWKFQDDILCCVLRRNWSYPAFWHESKCQERLAKFKFKYPRFNVPVFLVWNEQKLKNMGYIQ